MSSSTTLLIWNVALLPLHKINDITKILSHDFVTQPYRTTKSQYATVHIAQCNFAAQTRTDQSAFRSFSVAGPCLCNSLPVTLRDRDISLVQYQRLLKTLGLRRIVTVAFLRRVQIFLLTNLLTLSHSGGKVG